MERGGGAAVTCDGRLFHRRVAATGNALSPTVDRRVCRTSRDVDEAERTHLASVSAVCMYVCIFHEAVEHMLL